ncbi:MAG: type II secretion system minor pseudopilin GspH [Oceanospirillaceae bacterium]|nr:type II secretion system minor pseudopilin GspH [Oceanospirillaceae bacterium]
MSRERGFTLLELMVTMVLLGLLAVTVSLVLPDSARQRLETDAQRLRTQLGLAMEQAIYRNADYGLWVGGDDYRFFRRAGETWIDPAPDSRLAPLALDRATRLQLRVNGQSIAPVADHTPQVLLLSDGQVSEFELTLSAAGVDAQPAITASFAGDLRLRDRSQP